MRILQTLSRRIRSDEQRNQRRGTLPPSFDPYCALGFGPVGGRGRGRGSRPPARKSADELGFARGRNANAAPAGRARGRGGKGEAKGRRRGGGMRRGAKTNLARGFRVPTDWRSWCRLLVAVALWDKTAGCPIMQL